MKHITILLAAIIMFACAANSNAQTQVPNGGFENWSDTVTCQAWDGHISYGFGLFNQYFLTRTTDKHSGNFAAKIETKEDMLLGNIPGIVTLGKLEFSLLSGFSIEGGVPINSKPTKLKGFFKYDNVQGDTMAIVLFMYKWNTATNKRDTIVVKDFATNSTTPTYTPFNININYTPSSATPDTFNILLISSAGYAPQLGTKLYVDELSFEYANASIEEVTTEKVVEVYPNPANDFVRVDINSQNIAQVRIVNMIGQEVYINENVYKTDIINVSVLPEGIYFVEVKADRSYFTNKIVVTR